MNTTIEHFENSRPDEWLPMCARLCHVESGIELEFRQHRSPEGVVKTQCTIDGVVTVDSWQSAREIVTEAA